MAASNPQERTIDLDAVGEPISELVERLATSGGRVVVEKNGVRLAVIISEREIERLDRASDLSEAKRAEAWAVLEQFGAAFADVDPDGLQREVDNAVGEARAELRAKRAADGGH